MPLNHDVELPSDEELNIEEIPVTSNYLMSSAMWIGKYCDTQQKEFMLCRAEEKDPRVCLKYGKELTACGNDFLKRVKKSCGDELSWYTKCLDYSGREPSFRLCRHAQALYDGCMADSGFERARYGHFQLLRVHDSERPKPKPHVPIFDDAVPPYNIWEPEKRQKATIYGAWYRKWFQ